MLKFGNKEFANLQEQVAINQRAIQELKTGIKIAMAVSIDELANYVSEENLGKYFLVEQDNEEQYLYVMARNSEGIVNSYGLGKYPALGPEGPEGPEGQKGDQGRNPIIAIGSGPLPQAGDKYKFRDIYIASATGNGVVKGNVYQMNDIGRWVLQLNIVGPQGMPGQDIDEVVANPEEEAIEDIEKIKIDGVVYTIRAEDVYTKEEINSIVETIKKNAFVLVDTTKYPTLADFLVTTGEDGIIYLYPVNLLDLTEGYYQYIYEANEWIQLGSTNIDLSDYAKLNTANTFTAKQTFNGGIAIPDTYRSGEFTISDGTNGALYFYVNGNYQFNIADGYISARNYKAWNSSSEIGDSTTPFATAYITKFNPNASGYGFVTPSSSGLTADVELTTADDLATKLDTSFGGFSAYYSTATYGVNDRVVYQGKFYRCTTAVSIAEDFDKTKWTEITLSDLSFINMKAPSSLTTLTENEKDLIIAGAKVVGILSSSYKDTYFFPAQLDTQTNVYYGVAYSRLAWDNDRSGFISYSISKNANNLYTLTMNTSLKIEFSGRYNRLYINGKDVNGSVFYKTLSSGNIGSITSTAISTGWYRHTIAISGGVLDNAIDVRVKVQYLDQNNQTVVVNYPAILNNKTELVIFSGLDLQTEGAVVSAVYYRTA